MKRVLITGVTGLVGDGVCRYFLEKNWQVFGTSRRNIKSLHSNFVPIRLELGEEDYSVRLNSHLPFNAVIHCAAKLPYTLKSDNNINNYYNCNVTGTQHLLEWARKSKIEKFIFMSGTGVFDSTGSNSSETGIIAPKLNHYHTSKAMGELLCTVYNNFYPHVSVMRIKAPYGYKKNKSVLPTFLDLVKINKNIELWGSGLRSQIFTFVDDIGLACELCINKQNSNNVYNISGNEVISMKELAEKIIEIFPDTKSNIVFLNKEDPNEKEFDVISFDKAENEINYLPKFNIQSGLNKILQSSNTEFYSYKN